MQTPAPARHGGECTRFSRQLALILRRSTLAALQHGHWSLKPRSPSCLPTFLCAAPRRSLPLATKPATLDQLDINDWQVGAGAEAKQHMDG